MRRNLATISGIFELLLWTILLDECSILMDWHSVVISLILKLNWLWAMCYATILTYWNLKWQQLPKGKESIACYFSMHVLASFALFTFCIWHWFNFMIQILPEKYSYYRRFDQDPSHATDCVICMTTIDLMQRPNDCMVPCLIARPHFCYWSVTS